MRKKIFYCLLGLISGIGLFINFEAISILRVLLFCGIIFILFAYFNSNYLVFPIALFLGFFLSQNSFANYKLKDLSDLRAQITVVEKRKTDDSYRYFVNVRADGIKERSVLFYDEDLNIGDKLLVDGKISIPNRNTNPNLFNYRNYLISKGIASSLEIKKVFKTSQSRSILLNLKNKFYNYIHRIFENNLSKDSSDFIISVILGENLIENDDIKDLGLAHILAVSGLHMDLLLGFILFIFARLNFNYKYGYGFALVLCLFYGYLIGFPFSVVRVLIINFIGFLAFLTRMPEDKIKSLIIAAILILFINPFAILNAGFVLSFVATSSVYLIYPKIKSRLSTNLISQSIAFTTSIQVGLFPFTIFYYGNINLLTILANFLVVPIFTISMYLAFGIVIFYPLLKILLLPIFKILDYFLITILNIVSLLSRIKIFNFSFAHPSILVCIYFFILILIIFYIKRSNKKLLRFFYTSNLLVVFLSLSHSYLNPEVSFSMIDIGQGDAFLLNDGGDYYLFDVGGPIYDNYDSGEAILIPYLKSLGVKDIKAVFLTHEDSDHSGNIEILNNNFNIENILTSAQNTGSIISYNPITIKKDDRYKLKNGSVTCVFEGTAAEENAESVGYLIEIKGIKILTLGDLPKEYEDKLDIKSDILKVSHHGSKTSTSREFVERVNPKVALISAGRNNRYGHPTKEVLENLDGVKIYNTQTDGLVKIKFEDEIKIEKYLKGGYFRWNIKNLWKV